MVTKMNHRLLKDFVRAYPFQPATAFWRAVEIGVLVDQELPPGRYLDMGCGDGKLTRIIMDRIGPRPIVGVDPDPEETRMAETIGLYDAVHTAPGDRVPEPDESFDVAISNSVLEHIDDLSPVLQETARLLRPGGKFYFTVPSSDFHACLRGPLSPLGRRDRYLSELDRRLAHVHYLSVDAWEDRLGRAGLRLDRAEPYFSAPQVRRWETLSRFTAGLLYALFLRRTHPIRIQRRLGLRQAQARWKLPDALTSFIAWLSDLGMRRRSDGDAAGNPFGCVLLVGSK